MQRFNEIRYGHIPSSDEIMQRFNQLRYNTGTTNIRPARQTPSFQLVPPPCNINRFKNAANKTTGTYIGVPPPGLYQNPPIPPSPIPPPRKKYIPKKTTTYSAAP